jgi:hypothetical protein
MDLEVRRIVSVQFRLELLTKRKEFKVSMFTDIGIKN